jgi:DNA-binding NarL/FixJ family response regulator
MANKIEIDAITGEQVVTELTAKEITDQKEYVSGQNLIEASKEAKIVARESALAKLAALGLTEAEIAAL